MTQLYSLLVAGALAISTPHAKNGGEPQAQKQKAPARAQMALEEVFAVDDETYVVILVTEEEPPVYLPLEVDEMEAVAIRLKLDKLPSPEPLALNLLEEVIAAGKMQVSEISIDGFHEGMFSGHIRLVKDGKSFDMQARPCDAIGLAAGANIPIFVARDVLHQIGIDTEELDHAGEDAPPAEDTL